MNEETFNDTGAVALHRLTYTGRVGDLFRIFFVNLGLTIISLGIYRFWGKAKIRRYLWGHLYFQDEPFGYTGEGSELFGGFIKVLFLLFIPAIILWQILAITKVVVLGGLGATLLIFLFSPFVVFWVRRYRLGRSEWRGIHFQQRGHVVTYVAKAVLGSFLNLITLFIYAPYNAARLLDYQINRMSFGSLNFRMQRETKDISSPYILIWIVSIIAFVIFIGGQLMAFQHISKMVIVAHGKALPEVIKNNIGEIMLPIILSSCISIFFAIWARLQYRLIIFRYIASHTSLGRMRACFTPSFWQFFRLRLGNFFIKVCSLGLLSPLVTHRNMMFLCHHLKLKGVPDFEHIKQTTLATGTGEGWVQWFDIDALDF